MVRKSPAEKEFEDKFEKGDDGAYVRKRAEWFNKQRAYPNKNIPSGVRLRALKQMGTKLAAATGALQAAVHER